MNKPKARKFLEELHQLQEKYGMNLTSSYEEDLDYDYQGNPCVTGITTFLVITDEEGLEISLDDLKSGFSPCYYCGRRIEGDDNFCNSGCESKFLAKKRS